MKEHRVRKIAFAILATLFIGALIAGSVFVLKYTWKNDKPKVSYPLTVAVIGDTSTAGANNRTVWPTLMAQRTGWSVANFALPGAGFAADGNGGYAFPYQVERAQALHPQVILLVAGDSDAVFAGTGAVNEGALTTINRIKLGGERALVIGPTWYETPVPPSIQSISDEMKMAAEGAGVPFLDALNPPWLTQAEVQPDLGTPTDEGQSAIADKVAAWLRTQLAA